MVNARVRRRGAALMALLLGMAAVVVAVRPHGLGAASRCAAWMDKTLTADQRAHNLLAAMSIDDKVALTQNQSFLLHYGVAGFIAGNPGLCIPDLVLNDAGQGVGDGSINTTAFPSPISQASSWDPATQYQFGAMLGRQAWNKGINVQLAPGIEIDRLPMNGRNWEYMSEDPYLAGQTAAAVVSGIQSNPVVATVKHYVVNSQETNRTSDSSDVNERTIQEIYMGPYEAAVNQGHAGSVMCSYNRINSVYACENPTTLGWLKQELGFDGWVMSDWNATHSTAPAANAGLDQEMGATWSYFGPALKAAVLAGKVPQSRLDDMVLRIVRTMFRVGIFDRPAAAEPAAYVGNVDTPAANNLATQVAEQGMVLLKNQGDVLPLPAGNSSVPKRIAVIGPSAGPVAAEFTYNGGGSGHIPEAGYKPVTNPLTGMEQMAAGNGDLITYADGTSTAAAQAVASAADVAVVFAYDQEGEGTDRSSLALPSGYAACGLVGCTPGLVNQDQLISSVAAANPNTVVVLTTGGPVKMPWVNQVKGILEAWYPGQQQGNAIADVLFGLVNPSGKLTETFPMSEADLPTASAQQWPGIRHADDKVGPHTFYAEGLDVGYRWYDDKGIDPLFAFGYGLSYTKFSYSNLAVSGASSPDGRATVSFDVTNTGSRAGAEIAQVYVGAPADNYAGEPLNQLRGYQKVFLIPGQTAHVTVPIDSRAVSYWDVGSHGWTVETGCHPVLVGASSRDIRLQGAGLAEDLSTC